jgi:hypothetical protein
MTKVSNSKASPLVEVNGRYGWVGGDGGRAGRQKKKEKKGELWKKRVRGDPKIEI